MDLTAGDIKKAHGRLGDPDEIVHQRRVLYAAAVDISSGADRVHVADDVLDNPAVRGHLGAVLSGRASFSPEYLRPLAELVAPGFSIEVEGRQVRLASAPSAPSALAGALHRIAGELERHGDENGLLELLTVERRGSTDEAFTHLVEGVRLAVRIAPDLALDLLPHIGLFGAVVPGEFARLGSASAREYPGLIVFPEPRSALEVAEALIHEGAHQKFFDLGMTRDLLAGLSPQAPRFAPPWSPSGAPEWPLEQSVAAWHAYRCLAVFARCLIDSEVVTVLHEDSLLPEAAERAAAIGRHILGQGAFLGQDAHRLIAMLEGAPPRDPWPIDDAGPDLAAAVHDATAVVRQAGNRTLVACPGSPPLMYWLNSSVAIN